MRAHEEEDPKQQGHPNTHGRESDELGTMIHMEVFGLGAGCDLRLLRTDRRHAMFQPPDVDALNVNQRLHNLFYF